MNRFIVAASGKCIGCRTCEAACALAHDGAEVKDLLTPGFAPRLAVVRTRDLSTVVTCHHCEDAPCVKACPNSAIYYRQDSVQVDQSKCLGCKSCMVACPFGAMDVLAVPVTRRVGGVPMTVGVKALAHKCDLCFGREGGSACVSVCPTKALRVVEKADMDRVLKSRRQMAAAGLAVEMAAL